MKTRVDARLRKEAAQFAFRFACDDCVHFDAGGTSGTGGIPRCSLGFAAAPRRDALSRDSFESCKAFELA
jgi:hypothetical protein